MLGSAPLIALFVFGQVPLPGTSSVSVSMSAPGACRTCHGDFDPGSASDTWAGSAMGHAARDPLFLAALAVAEVDRPGVGDFCLRCHAPEAWLAGRCAPTDGSALTEDDSGVTCSFCHRMEPNPYVKNAQYIVGDDSDMRGPYGDSLAPHRKRQSDWLSDARACGTCHDLFLPGVNRLDLDGADTGVLFPEQTTYSEWLASDFAREGTSCIDCHMTEDTGPIAVGQQPRADRSNHGITGANVFLLDAIGFLYPGLGIADQLAAGRTRALASVRSAVSLELAETPTVARGQPVTLRLRVTNLTGHKLPTGYPEGRRMVVGVHSEDLGLSRGVYDEITGEPVDALEVYRVEQGRRSDGRAGPHLALNDTVFFDNRIPPRGFVSTATIAPVGPGYPEVAPGVLAHYDALTVTATVPCDPAATSVSGRFTAHFETVSPISIEDLLDTAAGHPDADRLALVVESVEPAPLLMAALAFELPIDPASTCAPPDAGVMDEGLPDLGATDVGVGGVPDAGIVRADAGTIAPEDEGCGCTIARRSRRSNAAPKDGPTNAPNGVPVDFPGAAVLGSIALLHLLRRRRS